MNGSGSTGAYIVAVSNAIKACGSIIRIDEQAFTDLIAKMKEPLIVTTSGGVFSGKNKYLTSYKGLTFFCKTKTAIDLPNDAEVIKAQKITIPDL